MRPRVGFGSALSDVCNEAQDPSGNNRFSDDQWQFNFSRYHRLCVFILKTQRVFLNGSNAQGNPYRFTQAAQSWRLLIHYLNRQAARGSSGVTERRCGLTQYGKPNSRQIMTA
ncbi:hypothetical protein QQF64_015466 [Cirrhinus molitorella]|uniref:Uncharacterized protein n=1 Tax=Cirrhinus molitorella TaxID=172907 RepID=A0ABR3NW99_9TELE